MSDIRFQLLVSNRETFDEACKDLGLNTLIDVAHRGWKQPWWSKDRSVSENSFKWAKLQFRTMLNYAVGDGEHTWSDWQDIPIVMKENSDGQ